MGHRCNICNRDFNNEEGLKQHNIAKHVSEEHRKINFRKYFIFAVIILSIILLAISFYNYVNRPGQYNDFAKCLTEKGAVIYGNDFCSYTVRQLNFFGNSKEYLDYVKCIDNEAECDSKSVSITPTWEINGESYSGVQTFERLSVLTGCEI